jgi:PA domain/FlgD Ig-like domain
VRARLLASLALLLLAASPAHATFIIVNTDGAGEGFNDPTAAAPVGGNPGTTVGQQRLNVFTKAGQIWDAILGGTVSIRVQSSFDPLPCSVTSGVLGSAGPNTVEADFAGAKFSSTWFVTAEANQLVGSDLEPGVDDIAAQFNSIVGTATCLTSRQWYYGFDGNEGATGIDLLPVLLHEFGHGLGFLTLTDETNGQEAGGLPTVFDRYLMDDVSNKHWFEMSTTERIASSINTTHLVWDGPAVTANAHTILGHRAHVVASGALTGDFIAGQGVFAPSLSGGGVTGNVVLVNDGVGTTSDGCNTPFVNAGAIAGKIALMDRSSTCSFAQRALNAQGAGAIGAIIINNVAGPEPQMTGATPTVTIPTVGVSQTDGNAIRTALGSGTVTVTIGLDPAHLAGADNAGKVQMFAPNPDQQGSSVSHFDVAAFPNLLMEPSINPDLSQNVDLTFHAFFDIGWFPQLAGVEPAPDRGLAFSLGPNPTRSGGLVRFTLPQARDIDVGVFDVSGRRVANLAHGAMAAGTHELSWRRVDDEGRPVAPGVYQVRLAAGPIERTLSLVVLQ